MSRSKLSIYKQPRECTHGWFAHGNLPRIGISPVQLKQKDRLWKWSVDYLESQDSLAGTWTLVVTYTWTNAFSSAACLITQATLQGQPICSHLLCQFQSNFSFACYLKCLRKAIWENRKRIKLYFRRNKGPVIFVLMIKIRNESWENKAWKIHSS
jgi:hypothetical protein